MTAGIFLSSILVYAVFGYNVKALQHAREDETPCSVDYTQRCSAVHAAQNYSLSLSSTEYSPKQMISGKLISTNQNCIHCFVWCIYIDLYVCMCINHVMYICMLRS